MLAGRLGWVLLCAAVALTGKPRLALEVSVPGGRTEVRDIAEQAGVKQVLMWRGPILRRLAATTAGGPNGLAIEGFSLTYWLDGDSVVVKAEAYRPMGGHLTDEALRNEVLNVWALRARHRGGPGESPWAGDKLEDIWTEAAGAATLHVSESATFPEVPQFQLQPLKVTIAPSRGTAPAMFTAESHARSIQAAMLTEVDYVGEMDHAFQLRLRNSSNQAAIWIDVCAFTGVGVGCHGFDRPDPVLFLPLSERSRGCYGRDRVDPILSGEEANWDCFGLVHGDPFLPGEDREIRDFIGGTGNTDVIGGTTAGVYSIEGALFEDGSSEGKRSSLDAVLLASTAAARIQNRRIREVVGRILDGAGADDEAKLALIRGELQALPEDLDKESLKTIHGRFGGLQGQWDYFPFRAKLYLRAQKHRVALALDGYERQRGTKSLAEWWNEWSRTL